MEIVVIKTKIREGALDDVRKWFKVLLDRKYEVIESLRQEGVIVEAAFLDSRPEGHYIIYYLKADNIEQAYSVFENSTLPIDQFYRKSWRQYFEGREELEVLLDIDLIASPKE